MTRCGLVELWRQRRSQPPGIPWRWLNTILVLHILYYYHDINGTCHRLELHLGLDSDELDLKDD